MRKSARPTLHIGHPVFIFVLGVQAMEDRRDPVLHGFGGVRMISQIREDSVGSETIKTC